MRLLDLFCGAGGAAMGYIPGYFTREEELAWAAGFFDGEGSTSIRNDRRPGRNPTVQLHIEQTDRAVLQRFADAVNWTGTVYERPRPRAPNRRLLYRIAMGHGDTLLTMSALWPYLSQPKRDQFIAIITALEDTPHAIA